MNRPLAGTSRDIAFGFQNSVQDCKGGIIYLVVQGYLYIVNGVHDDYSILLSLLHVDALARPMRLYINH